ncbi:protein sel-1 homolog 3 isoform X2 [Hyperolius riggenbachi]|uniref:protein sel-1 homolog 3 isoform X2 n=1 Tax=Hyperolius riggenbachi TaxID=752182 RepID=UPI0035A2EA3D
MLDRPRNPWLRIAASVCLCMIPLLCSANNTTSVTKQSEQYLDNRDYVALKNLPKTLANANFSVEYLCTEACVVHVDVVASSEFRTGVLVFKKSWKNENHLHQLQSRSVNLRLPSGMVYRSDHIMKHTIQVYYAVLRAWVVPIDHIERDFRHNETIFYAAAKSFAVLDTSPLQQRPYRDHQICVSWYFKLRWQQRKKSLSVCLFETDVSTILSFPLASNGEHSGLIKKFQPFKNMELEERRQQLIKHHPMFTFSIWMYLLDHCKNRECGILHHVDSKKMYATPLLFLTADGLVHVQMQLSKESDIAILSQFHLPLHQWVRLDVTIHKKMVMLHTFLGRELKVYQSQTYNVNEDIHFDDTDGYLALGGSKYVVSIHGFFGPVKYYRLRALTMDEISNPFPDEELLHQIQDYYGTCSKVKDIVQHHAYMQHKKHILETSSPTRNYYMDLYLKYQGRLICYLAPWTQEDKNTHSNLFNLLNTTEGITWDVWKDPVSEFGRKTYESAMRNLPSGFHLVNSSIPDLKDASCCGYHKASYLLSVIYDIGLGVPTDTSQAMLYSLIGAQGGDRLALLKLGYKHLQGIDAHNLDLDVAFSYYMNVAKKTPKDRSARDKDQAFVETIKLMDDDILKEQTRENDDLFLWLKQNAERGDPYAQHRLAQMLFWGQQGVAKDTKAAIEWYERGALENEEPVLMYDYAVLLFKGDGVLQNKKLALQLMKKAASKGQVEALNGLGWYYHNFKKDHFRAMRYWTEAHDKGNADAAFNLGVMHLHGMYPGESASNETRAFQYMSRAADGGHIEASINVANYFATGSLTSVRRDPETAIFLAKIVGEQNGNIGLIIRKAVNAYLDGSLNEAFLNFILAAEAGVESSQTNVAFLCEEHSELSQIPLRDICTWRYYNLSAHQQSPSTYALLKMGDMYYNGGKNQRRNLEQSAKMYTQAAALGDAQGFFNLAQLIEEGVSVPEYMLRHLKINTSVIMKNYTLVIELYERCQNHSSDETVSPCTLVLFYLHVKDAWNSILHSPMIYVLVSLVLAVFAVHCLYALQDLISHSRRDHSLQGSTPIDDSSYTVLDNDPRTPADRSSLANPHSELRNMQR